MLIILTFLPLVLFVSTSYLFVQSFNIVHQQRQQQQLPQSPNTYNCNSNTNTFLLLLSSHSYYSYSNRRYSTGSSNDIIKNNDNDDDSSNIIERKKKQRPSPTGFSYVEDGVYTNMIEEIEAMGGDPSFLPIVTIIDTNTTNDDISMTIQQGQDGVEEEKQQQLLSLQKVEEEVKWEWDGVEDADAYFDE